MTSSYYQSLPRPEQILYAQKLIHGVCMPDPLDNVVRESTFSTDWSMLPCITYLDVYHYLVDTACVYSRTEAYRSLDACNYFIRGKIRNLCSYRLNDHTIVFGKVGHSQSLSKTYSAWFVAKDASGAICSGHCTCMAGLGGMCSHVATILCAVEKYHCYGDAPVIYQSYSWLNPNEKIDPKPVTIQV